MLNLPGPVSYQKKMDPENDDFPASQKIDPSSLLGCRGGVPTVASIFTLIASWLMQPFPQLQIISLPDNTHSVFTPVIWMGQEYDCFLLGWPIFREYVGFRECKVWKFMKVMDGLFLNAMRIVHMTIPKAKGDVNNRTFVSFKTIRIELFLQKNWGGGPPGLLIRC